MSQNSDRYPEYPLPPANSARIQTESIAESKCQALKQLYPEVFTETGIDFDKLQRALGEWIEPDTETERFGLAWHGKAECMRLVQKPSIATLHPVPDESLNFDTTGNLFIESDNMEALKLLLRAYSGKVKMIYIDPPYNTGKEFVYSDKFSDPLKSYLEYTGQIDTNGRTNGTNTERSGRFHSNWLNMMYPRLYLARDLLRDDGAIFISTDDNELAHLRVISNEIFGEENFIANIAWQNFYTVKNDAKYFSENYTSILVYSKNKDALNISGIKRKNQYDKNFTNPDNDPRGRYQTTPLHAKSGNEKNRFKHKFKNGLEYIPPEGVYWRFSKATLKHLEEDNRIYFPKNSGSPRKKNFLSEISDKIKLSTFWSYEFAGSTGESSEELKKLFLKGGIFSYSKPTKLIKILLECLTSNKNEDLVLDFFAGSCTTADAVMQLNAEDGGNRRFIMVQLPEPCKPNTDATRNGYKTIADIGKERIRRAAKKIKTELDGKLNLAGNGTLDLGFKVFKLGHSNFKVWDSTPTSSTEDLEQQIFEQVHNITPKAIPQSILYELLLKEGWELTTPLKKYTLADKTIYVLENDAGEDEVLICVEPQLTETLMKALTETTVPRIICLDAAFNHNNQLKVNAAHWFKQKQMLDEGDQELIIF